MPTYKKLGEKAILVEWKPVISEHVLQDILRFKRSILAVKEVEDIVLGYNSLTLKLNKDIANFSFEVAQLEELYRKPIELEAIDNYIWEVPVCYDVNLGIDLKELSEKKSLSVQEIIQLHTKPLYTVYFIGFLPGFLYLGGLDMQLHTPRKATPRLRVNAGAVAIGGSQTGVYPQESAGGWSIIGQTPVNFFDVENEIPCFAKSGDKIKFVSIAMEEFLHLKEVKCKLKKELYNA